LLPMQSYTSTEYFAISRSFEADTSWAVLPDQSAQHLHKQEMVSQRGSR
jgi:hypothetical protein